MSRDFVAHEEALGRAVVVKVLAPELAAGLSSERFTHKVRLAAGLQHPSSPRCATPRPPAKGIPDDVARKRAQAA